MDSFCQHGHDAHPVTDIDIVVGGPTGFDDYPPIPERFHHEFKMRVMTPDGLERGTGYCPAFTTLPEQILGMGIWEPPETVAMLLAFERYPKHVFHDFGANFGWFSLLALSSKLDVVAWEADPEIFASLVLNLGRHKRSAQAIARRHWVTSNTEIPTPDGFRRIIAKLDIEGMEPAAIEALSPLMDRIDFMLIEISPVFNDLYADMVRAIMAAGFAAAAIPLKSIPPVGFDSLHDLRWETRFDPFWKNDVNGFDQMNALFWRAAR